jgi:hypothetical protein
MLFDDDRAAAVFILVGAGVAAAFAAEEGAGDG